MGLHNYFQINRFINLLKLELFRSLRGIFMAFEITFGMLFFFGLILTIVLDDTLVLFEHTQAYSFTLIVGGFVLTSLSFNDLSDSLKSQTYLSLPASIFEKFLSMWLMTSMGWIVLYSFTYYLYTLVANPIGLFIDGNMKFENFDPLSKHAVSTIKYYFVLQGVFLVGAAHFKGYVFPKTLFTIILIGLIVGLLMYFSMYDLMLESDECFSDSSSFEGMAIDRIWNMAAWSFWWLLAPFCWVMTYLGLKDREV